MNAFELFGTIAVNNKEAIGALDEVSTKGNSLASSLGSAFATAGKVIAKGAAAGAAAIGALTVASVKNYAEYEQLVGGVETLFKESSTAVMDYANNAYKSAGLSANEYMSTVTSFSASLLQGLGGDTAAAANIAHVAITDMADNANKMGTSMEMIQNAYQGFAKQNYTMLDNLKLGYGGTQAEMARLINDSGVLGEAFEATAENLREIPFDKQIEAIHAIQKEMGITGTTALEASATISGSWAAMGSAWKNLLVGISDDTQNLDTLINNFSDSVITVFQNISKRVPSLLKGVVGVTKGLFGELFDFVSLELFNTGVSFESIASKAKESFNNIASYFNDVFTEDGGINFKALGEALGNMYTDLQASIGNMFVDLATKTPELVAQVGESISSAWTNVVWPVIQGLFHAVFGIELPDWESVKTSISDGWKNNVWSGIQGLFSEKFGIELPAWETVKNDIQSWWTNVKNACINLFKAVFSVITEDKDGSAAAERILTWWDNVTAAVGDVFFAIFSIFTEDENGQTVAKRITEWWDKVTSAVGDIFRETFKIFTEDSNGQTVGKRITDWWKSVVEAVGDIFKETFKLVLPSWQSVKENIQNWWNNIKNSISLSLTASVRTSVSTSSSGSTHGGGAGARFNAAGAVFSKATLFDTRLGKQVVGEAGPEAVAPISVLQGYVSDAVAKQNTGIVNALERVVDAIDNMNEGMGNNLRAALDGVSVGVNKREFGRLVKAVT